MQIRIGGYLSASFLLQRERATWDALVVLDSHVAATDFVARRARRHLYLRFDDVDGPTEGRRLVTSSQIDQGLEFATGSDRLLVCCRAGQSRSAALAYVIACQDQGVETALGLLDPRRHVPNRLVVSLGSSLLKMPEVLRAFDRWRAEHRAIVLSDYYDEIEREYDALVDRGAVNRIVDD